MLLSKAVDKSIPSLVDQFEVVKGYWHDLDQNRMNYEIPINLVTKQLLDKKIASNLEVAKKIVRNVQQVKTSQVVNYDEFKRIFCKSIFKN